MACRLAGCEESAGQDAALYQITTRPGVAAAVGTAAARPAVPDQLGEPTVVTEGLTKVYPGGVVGVQDVSLRAHRGEIVAVLGPNGAGKSTTLNMLTGLLRPTRGSATIHGVATTDVRRLGKLVGVALQTSGLDPSMTAREHFETQAALYGVPRGTAAECTAMLLGLFGLEPFADRQVAHFSIGLQRRLALALAMLHDPPVVVLDEPTAGLDPQSRRLMWDLLERLRREGRTIIFSTQLLEEADALAQRLYIISDGRVVAEGPPSELRRSYGELTIRIRVAGSPDKVAELIGAKLPHLGPARQDGDALVLTTADGNGDAKRIMETLDGAGVELLELAVGRPSLEDAFVRLTGETVRPEPLVSSVAVGGPLCRCQ